MNKKITIPLLIALFILGTIGYYVFSSKVEVDTEGGVTTKKDALVAQEVSYEKDGTVFRFTKNRVSKTAGIDIQYGLADKDEFSDFLGSKVTTAPFMINLLCGALNQAFFDPEKARQDLQDASEAANLTEDSEFKNALEGYTVTGFRMEFKDKESNETIASCQSRQKGFESITFTASRDYSQYDSFFGQKIGVMQNDENDK